MVLEDFKRLLFHAVRFYDVHFVEVSLFALPFLLAYLLLLLAPAPTYLSTGALFIRTVSLPEFNWFQIFISIIVYALSIAVFSFAITNISLLVKSKRTATAIARESLNNFRHYSMRIFWIMVILLLLIFSFQLLSYNLNLQDGLFPLLLLLLSFLFFFAPSAVVIDDRDVFGALRDSIVLSLRRPFLTLGLLLFGSFLLLLFEVLIIPLIPYPFNSILMLLINSIVIFPFLTVLVVQTYMERYPMAR